MPTATTFKRKLRVVRAQRYEPVPPGSDSLERGDLREAICSGSWGGEPWRCDPAVPHIHQLGVPGSMPIRLGDYIVMEMPDGSQVREFSVLSAQEFASRFEPVICGGWKGLAAWLRAFKAFVRAPRPYAPRFESGIGFRIDTIYAGPADPEK